MRPFLLALAALFGSCAAHAESPLSAQPAVDTLPDMESIPMEPPMISQGDPSVRSIRIGNTTVGRAGCLAMSIYDALISLRHVSMDPATFVRMLSDSRMFTQDSKLRWNLGALFPVWTERFTISGAAALQKATAALSNGTQVLLQVRHGVRSHWVRVTRVVNGDAFIRDPDGGKTGWLSSRYRVNAVQGMVLVHG